MSRKIEKKDDDGAKGGNGKNIKEIPSKESTIRKVRKEMPKSIPELERQPLHQGLIALAGIIALVLFIPSFFISFGFLSIFKVPLGGIITLALLSCIFDVIFGFLFLYCYMLGRRKPRLSAGSAIIISFLIIITGGFAGILAGVMGLCGGAIGLLRRSRILPDSMRTGPPIIDEMFLMYKDGRLIRHYTRRLKPSIDEDILSSMLVAVQDFVKDSFERSTGEDSALDEMKFGEFKIVIGHGKHIIIAALVLGDSSLEMLRTQISDAVIDIETKYEPLLKDWNGVLDNLRPLNREMKDLIDGEYNGRIQYSHV